MSQVGQSGVVSRSSSDVGAIMVEGRPSSIGNSTEVTSIAGKIIHRSIRTPMMLGPSSSSSSARILSGNAQIIRGIPLLPSSLASCGTNVTLDNKIDSNKAASKVLSVALAVAKGDAALNAENRCVALKAFEDVLEVCVDSLSYFISFLKKEAHIDPSETEKLKKLTKELNLLVFESPDSLVHDWKNLRPSQDRILGVLFPERSTTVAPSNELLFKNIFKRFDNENDIYERELERYGQGSPLVGYDETPMKYIRHYEKLLKAMGFVKYSGESATDLYFERVWSRFRPIHEAPKDQITPEDRISLFMLHLDGKVYRKVDAYIRDYSEDNYIRMVRIMLEDHGHLWRIRQTVFKDLKNLPPPSNQVSDATHAREYYLRELLQLLRRLKYLKTDMHVVHKCIWPRVKSNLRHETLDFIIQMELQKVFSAEHVHWEKNPVEFYQSIYETLRPWPLLFAWHGLCAFLSSINIPSHLDQHLKQNGGQRIFPDCGMQQQKRTLSMLDKKVWKAFIRWCDRRIDQVAGLSTIFHLNVGSRASPAIRRRHI
ncbi:unnamed protein product [Notodromas monacha]|uniref:Uncharacterized protein n=1 Tax=Notodromas monacha TaxID=399045 RepID=A0A7R9BTJ9_9CRUS|nr:unnamed protein product [Notodromas monacha]CAG0921486.1 unnamed protein product [Notodromas monacha]